MEREWKTITSKMLYKNKWLSFYEDKVKRPDGSDGIYSYLNREPGVSIIIYDSIKDLIYLVEEYRYPIKKVLLALPGGGIDGEDILVAAKREVYEETGITANKLINIGRFYHAPGHETTWNAVALATDLDISNIKTNHQEGDESILNIVPVEVSKIKELLLSGKIEDGVAISSLSLFLFYIEKYKLS